MRVRMLALLKLISLRHLLGSPLRTGLTVMGVAVGVSTLVGISSINRSVMAAFRSTIDTVAGKARSDREVEGRIGTRQARVEAAERREDRTAHEHPARGDPEDVALDVVLGLVELVDHHGQRPAERRHRLAERRDDGGLAQEDLQHPA